eukprot:scaffold1038_cov122-Isochrysis_galbana.AAC.9
MIEATQTLDAILQSSRGKRKKTPLKAYYCDVDGEIIYLLYKAKDDTYTIALYATHKAAYTSKRKCP